MAAIHVDLPSALTAITGAPRTIALEAGTLREALDRLIAAQPRLATHLFDESGAFRKHVFCIVNGANTRWMKDREGALRDGDRVTIMQAVSGG